MDMAMTALATKRGRRSSGCDSGAGGDMVNEGTGDETSVVNLQSPDHHRTDMYTASAGSGNTCSDV